MLWFCADCPAAYAVGQSACPQCGSIAYFAEGSEDLVKITGYEQQKEIPTPAANQAPAVFEPSDHTVREVLDHLASGTDVDEAERTGKNRKVITSTRTRPTR
jgi:hypothetical protein